MVNYTPVKMLEFIRDGLVEQEHWGLLVQVSSDGNVFKLGDDCDYPFYLRSCAKPLQAVLIVDFGIDDAFNMTSEEIALCCASHAGEERHAKVAKGFLKKIGLDESYMKCGLHKPLSKTERNKLIENGQEENIFQNNCSGKHVMMLAICKKMGWAVENYDSPEHPLQGAIKKKIFELCEVKAEYPVTKDGCGVPIYSMPLENMVKGYLNLFLDEKYSKIKDAFLKHPYLIGGEGRFDTAVMTAVQMGNGKNEANSKQQTANGNDENLSPIHLFTYSPEKTLHSSLFTPHLIVKSGAGGICIAVNLEKKEGFIIKIMDSDMKARAICTIEALKQLGWLSKEMFEHDLIKAQNKTDILTLHGEKIGEAVPCFKF